MTRGSGVSVLACALGVAGLVALGGCQARPKAETRGPFLNILPREGATIARGAIPPGVIALALGGVPPGELPRMRERLEESMEEAVRRAAPTVYELDDLEVDAGAPDPDPLRRALPGLPPLTAAANVLGAPWGAPGVSVELGPACQPAASRCVPLFAAAIDRSDPLVRHGRALAWGLVNAARLRAPPSSRAALLRSLGETQTRPASTIALVFGASRGTLDESELDLLRQQARRVLAHLAPNTPRRAWLDALSVAPSGWALPIVLDADEVLVVPRLGALARLQDFDVEVGHAGSFEWVARPE